MSWNWENRTVSEQVEQNRTNIKENQEALTAKADKTDVSNSLALKADKTDVTNSLALKADKVYVTNSLALKADKANTYTKLETTDLLKKKAERIDLLILENEVDTKVDINTYTFDLIKKADRDLSNVKVDIINKDKYLKIDTLGKIEYDNINIDTYTKQEINNKLVTKLNVVTFESEMIRKADKLNTFTKTETSELLIDYNSRHKKDFIALTLGGTDFINHSDGTNFNTINYNVFDYEWDYVPNVNSLFEIFRTDNKINIRARDVNLLTDSTRSLKLYYNVGGTFATNFTDGWQMNFRHEFQRKLSNNVVDKVAKESKYTKNILTKVNTNQIDSGDLFMGTFLFNELDLKNDAVSISNFISHNGKSRINFNRFNIIIVIK